MASDQQSYEVAAGELRQFIERAEQVDAEMAERKAELKAIFDEAKGRGYSAPAMRQILALRKRDKDEVAEAEAILGMYRAALGMA